MVNVTEILDEGDVVISPIKEISNFVQDKIADFGVTFPDALSTLLTIFIGVALVWIATKITNKVAKIILWIVGILLIVGIILGFISAV